MMVAASVTSGWTLAFGSEAVWSLAFEVEVDGWALSFGEGGACSGGEAVVKIKFVESPICIATFRLFVGFFRSASLPRFLDGVFNVSGGEFC